MHQRQLGKTNLTVPVIGMGTWRTLDVHDAAGRANAMHIVAEALAAGSKLFDASPMYGSAEETLAEALAEALAGRRDEAIVATKVWSSDRREGERQISRALTWFGGYVDIYQVHNLVAWREWLPVLERMREEGKIGAIGATHYAHSAFGELKTVMRSGRIDMVQIPYNVTDREVERELLPLAADLGLGVLVMRPLGEGELVRRAPDAKALAPLSRFGVKTWAQALLKWAVSDPRVHCAIPATSQPQRARENAAEGDEPFLDQAARDYVADLATQR